MRSDWRLRVCLPRCSCRIGGTDGSQLLLPQVWLTSSGHHKPWVGLLGSWDPAYYGMANILRPWAGMTPCLLHTTPTRCHCRSCHPCYLLMQSTPQLSACTAQTHPGIRAHRCARQGLISYFPSVKPVWPNPTLFSWAGGRGMGEEFYAPGKARTDSGDIPKLTMKC